MRDEVRLMSAIEKETAWPSKSSQNILRVAWLLSHSPTVDQFIFMAETRKASVLLKFQMSGKYCTVKDSAISKLGGTLAIKKKKLVYIMWF